MYSFCSYLDHNYLSRALALYESLEKHFPEFELYVLCLSDQCYNILQRLDLPKVQLIKLKEFESYDTDLREAKKNRSVIEYYFTMSPCLPLFIFSRFPNVQMITYLDTDLYFFSNPKVIFEEISDHSIAIIEHRFSPHLKHREIYGIYNVAWNTFRRDENALECLNWWRERSIEWCYDRVEEGKYNEQRYLDDWPERFNKVIVIKHKGANLAPWNIDNYHISTRNGNVFVDNDPLIFYHFHAVKQIKGPLYDSGLSLYESKLTENILEFIYKPYIKHLRKVEESVRSKNINLWYDDIRERAKYIKLEELLPQTYAIIKKIRTVIKLIYTKTYILDYG